jgi:hypothetical protein
VYDLERDVRASMHHETQREIQKLREELFKSRRAESQRDREVRFLQRQLTEAADRITLLDKDRLELIEIKRTVHQLQQSQQQQQSQQFNSPNGKAATSRHTPVR